ISKRLQKNTLLCASGLRYLEVAETLGVSRNAVEQRFRHLLAVLRTLQERLLAGVAQETDFGQDGGHIRADQHHKRRLLDAPVSDAGRILHRQRIESALYPACKF